MLRVKGNYKRNQDRKLLQGLKNEKTKNCNKKLRLQKTGEQATGGTVLARCTVAVAKALLQCSIFLHILLFFPSDL